MTLSSSLRSGVGGLRRVCRVTLVLATLSAAGLSCASGPSAEYGEYAEGLRTAEDDDVALAFFEKFVSLGEEDAEYALRHIKDERNPAVREASVRLIARHFGREHMALYRQLTLDPHPGVRWAAASEIFKNTAEPEDVAVMRRLVRESDFAGDRNEAMLWLLCPRRTDDILPDVLAGLKSDDMMVRCFAVHGLVSLEWPKGKWTVSELVEFLRAHKHDIDDEDVHPDVYYALLFLEQVRDQWERKPWLDDFETQEARIEGVLNWWDNWEKDNPWKETADTPEEPEPVSP